VLWMDRLASHVGETQPWQSPALPALRGNWELAVTACQRALGILEQLVALKGRGTL
jgi:hypothetical protein